MSVFFSAEDASAPHPRQARRHGSRWVLALLAALAALVAVALAVGTGYLVTVSHSVAENLQRSEELPPEIPVDPGGAPRPTKAPAAVDAVNYVLMGSDRRTGSGGRGRSDVLMVLHLAGDRKDACLISFPRDLYVPIPGHGKDKINAAFALGGTSLTIRTLEGLLGTRMDHVALIDFAGFVNLTEQLGGVTLDNPHPSASQGYSFPAGRITLSGPEALAYVRERKQLPRGDLDRAERQRLVAQAVLTKGLSRQTLLNPVAFTDFVGELAHQVTVDEALTVPELRRTALSVRFRPDDIASVQAPVRGFGTTRSGESIDVVDRAQLKELAWALQNDRMRSYLAEHPEG